MAPGAGRRLDAGVVVLGAGPAGLVAARSLAARGVDVLVLEAAGTPGGMAASIEVAGIRVDLGSHRLHPAMAPEARAVVTELLGADLQVRPRRGRVAIGGALVRFPLDPLDLARHLPLGTALPFARDAVTGTLRLGHGRDAPVSFADAVRTGLGRTALERFYGPYARKLWGVEPEDLAADLARRRVTANSPGAIVGRLARAVRGPQVFWYPRTGFGLLVERLADAAVGAGADLRLGHRVTGLRQHGDGAVLTVIAEGATVEVRAGAVLSTVPMTRLAAMVGDAPAAVTAALDGMTSRGMALVYLVLDVDRWTSWDATYLPGPETVVSRVSEPKNYRDGPDPSGVTVLCAEVPCTAGDALWSMPDDRLADRVADELGGMGLPVVAFHEHHVVRLPNVYPVHRIGVEARLATVAAWLDGVGGLVSFGRQGLFVPDNTHHALVMGLRAAAVVDGAGGIDRAAWARARSSFASHVVED